jgi:hypothetical protein
MAGKRAGPPPLLLLLLVLAAPPVYEFGESWVQLLHSVLSGILHGFSCLLSDTLSSSGIACSGSSSA